MNWRWLPLAALVLLGVSCTGGASTDAVRQVVIPADLARDSVTTQGAQATGASTSARLSGTGEFDLFASLAADLVVGDTNGVSDVFSRDRFVRITERVSVSFSGAEGNGPSTQPAPNGDGGQVAFTSAASNLVPNDVNGATDVFVRDRVNGLTQRLSVSETGNPGDGASFSPSSDSGGVSVAFASDSTNLVAGDTNGLTDVFVRDRAALTTTRVSVDSGSNQADGPSFTPGISPNGRFVAFASDATNLVSGDTNGVTDVFVHDRTTGTTVRASLDSGGIQGDGPSLAPVLSFDGRFVAFESLATNLVPGDTNGVSDVFLRDLLNGTTVRVSVDSAGLQANGPSAAASVSLDAGRVAFHSLATNLVTGDTNGVSDVFVRTTGTATTTRFSLSVSGGEGNGASAFPSLSYSGGTGAFQSLATNLVSGDTNGVSDVFSTPLP